MSSRPSADPLLRRMTLAGYGVAAAAAAATVGLIAGVAHNNANASTTTSTGNAVSHSDDDGYESDDSGSFNGSNQSVPNGGLAPAQQGAPVLGGSNGS